MASASTSGTQQPPLEEAASLPVPGDASLGSFEQVPSVAITSPSGVATSGPSNVASVEQPIAGAILGRRLNS